MIEKNKQLENQNKMQQEFLSIDVYEIRSPIQVIIGYSEMLEMDPQHYKQYVTSIVNNTKRLELLAKNILDVIKFSV